MSTPPGVPGHVAGLPLQWQTINPAHAIQRAAGVITFSEPVTSFVVKRIADTVRSEAHALGLVKEEAINTVLMQIGPGAAAQPAQSASQTGTMFQKVSGGNVVQSLAITTDAIRFDTFAYTRWIGFRDQFERVLSAVMPVASQASQVKSVGLEYIDFFFAINEGPADIQQIIDRGSDLIAKKSFNRQKPFHSHAGWFEGEADHGMTLVNVDLTVSDAAGPMGLRRAITIRTHEAVQITNFASPKAAQFVDATGILDTMDVLHTSLKKRLKGLLTRNAAATISLGA